jgi:hypothetical protein
MFLPWQWVALVVIALLGGAATIHYQRKADAIAARLTPEERQTFQTRYLNRGDRAEMPERFKDLAAATDRVRGARTGVTLIVAIAVLFFVI